MDEDEPRDPHDEIVQLEARIEKLNETIVSCRKVIAVSRGAIVLGATLLAAIMLGALRFDPMFMIAGVAGVLGGIVLLGSNSSTAKEATDALQAAEARRAGLIGQFRLRVVGNGHV
jgi:hypothetical protein